MSPGDHFSALKREARQRATGWLLAHRVRARHPTLRCHPSAIWDYGYRDIDAIEIGLRVSVGAFAEILVYRRATHSSTEGRLVLEDGAVISTGVNLRAAGGTIRIGAGSAIGQNAALIAANHRIVPGEKRINTPWDETRCGVDIGSNVWIGANCVLVPGCRVGDDAVVGAGSVVTGFVPPGELWAGVPARKIRSIESRPADFMRSMHRPHA